MEELNQQLINQLKNGEITIYYTPSRGAKENLKKLIRVLKTAFPEDIAPSGESIYYRRHSNIPIRWTGTNYDDGYREVLIDDFFKPSEVSINYSIY